MNLKIHDSINRNSSFQTVIFVNCQTNNTLTIVKQ